VREEVDGSAAVNEIVAAPGPQHPAPQQPPPQGGPGPQPHPSAPNGSAPNGSAPNGSAPNGWGPPGGHPGAQRPQQPYASPHPHYAAQGGHPGQGPAGLTQPVAPLFTPGQPGPYPNSPGPYGQPGYGPSPQGPGQRGAAPGQHGPQGFAQHPGGPPSTYGPPQFGSPGWAGQQGRGPGQQQGPPSRGGQPSGAPQWAPGQPPNLVSAGRGKSRAPLAIGVAVVLVLAVVGVLGFVQPGFFVTRVFDTVAIQDGVQRVLTQDYGLPGVASVTCPEGVQVVVGAAFECQATVDGEPVTVPIRVTSQDGGYEVGRPA
jgi:Domain of unknown function (DUF4333)